MRVFWILLCLCLFSNNALAQGPETSLGVMGDQLGKHYKTARKRLQERGLKTVHLLQVVSEQEEGLVVGQSPKAGTPLKETSRVVLRVSRGPSKLQIQGKEIHEEQQEQSSILPLVMYGILQLGVLLLIVLGLTLLKKAAFEKEVLVLSLIHI